jgi:hypothetical protein
MVPRISSNPPNTRREIAIAGDGFVPELMLREWERSEGVVLSPGLMTCPDGKKYVLVEALRILGPQSAETDPYGLTGRVSTLRELLRQGGVLRDDAMRLGATVYDVEFGFVARRMGTADESGAYQKIVD